MNDRPIRLDSDLKGLGLKGFFGGWFVGGEINALVDVGPANGVATYLGGLEDLGVDRLDLILLTHVHIDHSGALSWVLEKYPEARIVVHDSGVRFLADPTRLWEGSLQVLGDMARLQGQPRPCPTDNIIGHIQADVPGLTIVETPGHAAHHLSYSLGGFLFAGEAGGNLFLPGGRQYLRPATPPRFFLETTLASVDRLLELPDQPMFYAHREWASSSREMLRRSRAQYLRWAEIVGRVMNEGPEGDMIERATEALLAEDPELAAFEVMSDEEKTRERNYMANSIRGYAGYLKSRTDQAG